jgi:hypothetical protein
MKCKYFMQCMLSDALDNTIYQKNNCFCFNQVRAEKDCPVYKGVNK